MVRANIPEVMESVAKVTSERDIDNLRLSVLKTLREILPVESAGFLSIPPPPSKQHRRQADQGSVSDWAAEIPDEILTLSSGGQPATVWSGDGKGLLHVQPISEEEALGVQLRHGSTDDVRIVQAFSRLYANFKTLIHESEHDRLTGLYNRRSFDTYLARLTEKALKSLTEEQLQTETVNPVRRRWWLALFDVDHFKRINDTYGHLYGDEVLLLLARQVRQLFRGEDRCFRYGGEEFAVLLSRTDAAGVEIALERLRQQVERYAFPQVGKVTISIGYADLEPGVGPSTIIERADRALYQAKSQGRNRLIGHLSRAGDTGSQREGKFGPVELF